MERSSKTTTNITTNIIKSNQIILGAVKKIKAIYEALEKETDLSPNNEALNEKLTELYEFIFKLHKKYGDNKYIINEILNHETIKKINGDLKQITGQIECELEKHWSKKLSEMEGDITLERVLEEFPYGKNYEELFKKEYRLTTNTKTNESIFKNCSSEKDSSNVISIGSGGLPLTAMLFANKFKIAIDLLDIDEEAIAISSNLVKKLNMPINLIHGDATKFDYKNGKYKVALVASLVPQKTEFLQKLKDAGVHYILTRGAEGIFQILYDSVDVEEFKNILYTQEELKTHNIHSKHIKSDNKNTNSPFIISTPNAPGMSKEESVLQKRGETTVHTPKIGKFETMHKRILFASTKEELQKKDRTNSNRTTLNTDILPSNLISFPTITPTKREEVKKNNYERFLKMRQMRKTHPHYRG